MEKIFVSLKAGLDLRHAQLLGHADNVKKMGLPLRLPDHTNRQVVASILFFSSSSSSPSCLTLPLFLPFSRSRQEMKP